MRAYTLAFIQGFAELIPLRLLLPCGIVCADLASCWSGAVGASLVLEECIEGFPP
jgi:hypothetical protein